MLSSDFTIRTNFALKVFESISDAIAFVTKPNKVPLWRQYSLRHCCFYFISSSMNAEFLFSQAKLLKNGDLGYLSFRPRAKSSLSAICQPNPKNTIACIHAGFQSFKPLFHKWPRQNFNTISIEIFRWSLLWLPLAFEWTIDKSGLVRPWAESNFIINFFNLTRKIMVLWTHDLCDTGAALYQLS